MPVSLLISRDASSESAPLLAGGKIAQTNLALSIVFPLLAALTVVGRFYARRLKRMAPGLDDWLILAALILHMAQMSMGILRDVKGGFGLPSNEMTLEQSRIFNQASYANNVFYPVVLTLARFSICVLVIKIFSVSSLRWAGYANLIFCTAWLFYCILTGMLRCHPLSKVWHANDQSHPGHCSDELPEIIKNAAWNIVCDLTTAALPTAGVWRLQLNRAHKWGLTVVFALAFVVIATAAARIGVSVVTEKGHVTPGYAASRTNLSFVEASLSIVVACAPTLRPIFTTALFHIRTTHGSSHFDAHGFLSDRRRRRRRRGSALRGFATLPDAYACDDKGRHKTPGEITVVPLYEIHTNATTTADGSPVPMDKRWSPVTAGARESDQQIRVTYEVSVLTDVV